MAKYLIEIDEPQNCNECVLWKFLYRANCSVCAISDDIDNIDGFPYYKEIHKDCPLKKVEE